MIDSREDFYDGDDHAVIDFSLVMDSRVAHSLGANVMFGPIQLGFSREVGPVENRNRTFAIRTFSPRRAVQRRSAGSWIVGAKYMYGATVIDSQDLAVITLSSGLGRFATHEISVGAGCAT